MYLFLNTTREGYAPEQIAETMTVGELKQLLWDYDEDELVLFRNDGGYTYGGLSWMTIREGEE